MACLQVGLPPRHQIKGKQLSPSVARMLAVTALHDVPCPQLRLVYLIYKKNLLAAFAVKKEL
ncbi:MAG: hypothetical protein QW343_03270 [Candidatus Norongarragalinales archaeon]